jgi:putative transcriptional regulator
MPFASLQGQLLVAAPLLVDPNFRRSVVLVCEHSPESAMGLILNRPTAIVANDAVPVLERVLAPADRLHEGGPVQRASILALAEFRDPELSGGIAFGNVGYVAADTDADVLRDGITRIRVFAGYAGWGAGQLDDELDGAAWIPAPAHPDDIFGGTPTDGLWSAALERLGGRYRLLARMPADPSVN